MHLSAASHLLVQLHLALFRRFCVGCEFFHVIALANHWREPAIVLRQ
jgi:hypothetical protein